MRWIVASISWLFVLGQTIIMQGADGRPEPTYCGRRCNCGQGRIERADVDGKRRTVVLPPNGAYCTCEDVFLCSSSDAPRHIDPPSCNSGWFVH